MNKELSTVVIGAAALFALSTVIASSQGYTTPLYTVRMEQASSRMNFLPTAVNQFTYTAEKGYTVNYNAAGYCGAPLEITVGKTCDGTCDIDPTCPHTCRSTCDDPTCGETCPDTCQLTCDTCYHTCALCTFDTCFISCVGFCQPTGEPGCW